MSQENRIAQLITNQGIVRSRNTGFVKMGSDLFTGDLPTRLDPLCWDATVSVSKDLFEITAVKLGTPGANNVIVANDTNYAAAGQLSPPGILFSEEFSGCLFFLFRDNYGSIYGVHAFRASGTYPDPMPYFNRIGAKLLYFFDTGGRFSAYGVGTYGSVICNVMTNKIVIDFVATRQGKIVGAVDHKVINNWRTATGIQAPNIGNAMAPYDADAYNANSLQSTAAGHVSPKKAGLKARVANFLLRYH